MEKFAQRLKKLREDKRLSQQELADILLVSQSYYSKFEVSKGEPNLELLIKIADFFEVSTDFLLGRTNIDAFAGREKIDQDLENRISDLEKFVFNLKNEKRTT